MLFGLWVVRMIDLIERYENSKSAILLSNLTPTEVKVFLGERVFDRLREDGGKAIAFDWESHGGSKSAESAGADTCFLRSQFEG